ncbi:MAG: hypothetical protein LBB88_12090 [Planctomycetaceae bacterium]|jgi:tetratricopeptide (TPR) repeat protein|nr:hypothetical protein [Planctomycetaceae bacterium]
MKRRDFLLGGLGELSIAICLPTIYADNPIDELEDADITFKKKDFVNAINKYKKIRVQYASKNLVDKRQYCTSQIIRCLRRVGNLSLASEEYFQYSRINPIVSLELTPLIWSASIALIQGTKPDPQTSLNILRQTNQSNPNPSAELLAASILSVNQEQSYRNIGLHHLRKLSNQPESDFDSKSDKLSNDLNDNNSSTQSPELKQSDSMKKLSHEISLLAGALLWKEQIPILHNEKELATFQRLIKQIPESIRGGAFFLYGKSAAQVGLLEEAVVAMMKIPVHYAEDTILVLESLNESAKFLNKLNRKKQAEQLQNEALELKNTFFM